MSKVCFKPFAAKKRVRYGARDDAGPADHD